MDLPFLSTIVKHCAKYIVYQFVEPSQQPSNKVLSNLPKVTGLVTNGDLRQINHVVQE